MNVLVACEESQRVTIEFRKLGHNAYSCDLLECSGNHPEWHIKKDVTLLLNGNCIFNTVDGVEHEISGKWDMIIAFPPCTYLTVTGNRWYNYEKYGDKAIQRMLDRNDAIKFFMIVVNADCDKIAIENPVGIMSTQWRKPDQIIQPYQYGDAYEKRTCLWLKGLPMLSPTKIVEIPDRIQFKSGKTMAKWYVEAGNLSKEQRALVRSKTFPGIAKAMATQWGSEESIQSEEKHYDDYTSEDFINAGIAKECKQKPPKGHIYIDTDSVKVEPLPEQQTSEESIKDTVIVDDTIAYQNARVKETKPTVLNVMQCMMCPADREGNRCGGEQWCKQIWKRYGAIVNPEWHHVSLATLANIDFDMLDEKRKLVFDINQILKDGIRNLYKCENHISFEVLERYVIRKCDELIRHNRLKAFWFSYIARQLDDVRRNTIYLYTPYITAHRNRW